MSLKMSIGLFKILVIKYCPKNIVNLLRKQRQLRESIYRFLYMFGINKNENYPYYLKLKSKKQVSTDVSYSNCINKRWGEAFCKYNSDKAKKNVDLVWADSPIPGNYGDWLSPYIINKLGKVNVTHLDEVSNSSKKHIVALGSIICSVNENSFVLGTGIPSKDENINVKATFISVRGTYTDERIVELGGNKVNNYGDIGFLMRRVYNPKTTDHKKDILVVRHIQQASIRLELKPGFREISINAAHPRDIENFVDELHTAELVVTSAMHCFITCISYGIPCVLFSLGGWKNNVPGDGVKYLDTLSGVNLPEVKPYQIVEPECFCEEICKALIYKEVVGENELDNIENVLLKTINECIY